jgi:hypothetical protein
MMMKRVKYIVPGFFFKDSPHTSCYIMSDETGMHSAAGESWTGYQVTSMHEVAKYTKIHIKCNVPISRKLQYPATI